MRLTWWLLDSPSKKYGDGGIECITPLRSKRIAQEQVLRNQQTGQIPKPIQSIQELACSRRSDNRARAKNEGVNGRTQFSVKF